MQQIGIRTRGSQTGTKAVFKHIGAAAGVFANDDAGRIGVAVALTEHVVMPAQKAAYFVGMICGQSDSGFATEAISSKVFSHYGDCILIQRVNMRICICF